MKKILRRLFLPVVLISVLIFFYRLAFCPQLIIAQGIKLSQETFNAMQRNLKDNILDNAELAQEIKSKKIILIGETHFQDKVMGYFTDLLGEIGDKTIILTLELPESMQETLDSYMKTGDEKYLSAIKACSDCLPYHSIVKWCFDHKNYVERVFAVDENRSRTFLMRCVCYDTRNTTMAKNILKSYREYPDRIIVFYGGQLHCLLNGRYLYNVENRTPVGKLLQQNGIRRSDISTILLDYNDHFPSSAAWSGSIGAARTRSELGKLPVNFFVRDTIFGVKQAQEAFDYYVNVGSVTDTVP